MKPPPVMALGPRVHLSPLKWAPSGAGSHGVPRGVPGGAILAIFSGTVTRRSIYRTTTFPAVAGSRLQLRRDASLSTQPPSHNNN